MQQKVESKSGSTTPDPAAVDWERLVVEAWNVRDNAYIIGETRVGAAVLTAEGYVYAGCNVEHKYRCHDVHAEVNAITSMVAAGGKRLKAIAVVAERERFTPCGGCMDWIYQFGTGDCQVGYQTSKGSPVVVHTAGELMPFYPR